MNGPLSGIVATSWGELSLAGAARVARHEGAGRIQLLQSGGGLGSRGVLVQGRTQVGLLAWPRLLLPPTICSPAADRGLHLKRVRYSHGRPSCCRRPHRLRRRCHLAVRTAADWGHVCPGQAQLVLLCGCQTSKVHNNRRQEHSIAVALVAVPPQLRPALTTATPPHLLHDSSAPPPPPLPLQPLSPRRHCLCIELPRWVQGRGKRCG